MKMLSDSALTQKGMRILNKELGLVDTARFVLLVLRDSKTAKEGACENEIRDCGEEEDLDKIVFIQALGFMLETKKARCSTLQRHLRLGYTRAARIMDELEKRGCVGSPVGSGGARDVNPQRVHEEIAKLVK